MTYFDRTTAVSPTGEGRWAAALDGGWKVGGGLNGGYLLAVVGRALRETLAPSGKPDPVSVSAYYLTAATEGPAEVVVDVRRDGGSSAVASADLVQDGQTRLTVLATYGDLDRDADDVQTTATELELPPREECQGREHLPAAFQDMAPLLHRFDALQDPAHTGWAVGEPDHSGALAAWFRLEDEREPDPLSLLLTVDALPPVMFTHGRMGWAPTVELTVHVRAKPAPGWLKVRHATRNIAGGLFEEDCEVWDSAGRLVAQSRQLARLPR